MKETVKYDPLHTFLLNDRQNKYIDNIIFLKIQDDLQSKINGLMKELIVEEDENRIDELKLILRNTIKDQEDAKRNLEINLKKGNEVPILNNWKQRNV